MKKVYFKGYYGNENLGNDVFTVTAAWACKNYWENYIPIFIGKKLPAIENQNIIVIEASGLKKRIIELYYAIISHKIIYFGGSLFSDGGKTITNLKYIIRKISMLSNKTSALGVSVGPFINKSNYQSTKDFMKKLEYIGVRDYKSLEVLKTMGISKTARFSFDLAILLSEVYPELKNVKKSNDGIKIGVSLTRNSSYDGKNIQREIEREESFKKSLENLIDTNQNIKELTFIEFNGDKGIGDQLITQEFYHYFKDKINCSIIPE